jgi:decaprenylphospho-beta-D-erythro-pentofuranosid-2-ulose 2-reductase
MAYVLLLGAKSDIAKAIAHEYARHGYDLYVAARKSEELDGDVNDLKIRYSINAVNVEFDALDYDSHQAFWDGLDPKPLGVICVFGYLGQQNEAQTNFAIARRIIDTNYTGCVSILHIAANTMEEQKKGFIVGISSVAGDRGRPSNYVYGSAKSAFTEFLSGLRARLFHSQVSVLTVKPGFVYTKMTEGMDLPVRLTAQPEEIARAVFKAQQSGRNVIYTKWFWRFILLIIRHIPETIFKRLKT